MSADRRGPSSRKLPPLGALALALAVATGLSACGKKPKVLDPPQGWETNTFPRRYPAPEDGRSAIRGKPESGPNLGAPNAGSTGGVDPYGEGFPESGPVDPAFGGVIPPPNTDTTTSPSSGGSTKK